PQYHLRLSSDGTRLVVVSHAHGQDTHLTVVSMLEPGRPGWFPEAVISLAGAPINAGDPCWSPDGCTLAFSSDSLGDYQIGLYDVETGDLAWLTGGPGDKSLPDWSPDGKRLAYLVSEGAQTWAAVQDYAADSLAARYQV